MTHSMKFSFLTKLSFLVVLLFSMTTSPTMAQEGQAIGRVLSTSGSVTAQDLNGALRELRRRSDIFVGDTIVTGPNGFAQLRMVDSAQISFKEDTEFTFAEYSSDGPGGAADSALMEMVRGGFRTISGTIGDDAADDYQVSTQFASIGIRGTTHEAVIDANSLLTGVYDGGTTIANGQGSLDTGEGANFNYSQTFPGQAPQGLLQQPAQLGNINLNGGGDDDDDDGDDGDGDGDDGAGDGDGDDGADDGEGDDGADNGEGDDGNGNQDGNAGDGNDNGNDGGDGDDNGGIADAGDAEAGARAPVNPPNTPPGVGLATGGANTNVDPALDTTRTTEVNINPVINVRARDDFEETGAGTIEQEFIQPNETFLALVSNSGFNTDFSLSELQGVTGRFSEVLAFNGLADIGGSIGAAAVGDNGPTTSITSLTMTFDLNFSASLARVSNGFLGIKLDDAPTPIAFNIFFSGDIIDSQSNFTLSSNSNRVQGSQSTAIDLQTSFLNSILVDDGVEQALFSDFFFEDTQGLGVEGQALVGFATPVLSPADNARISDRVGFVLSRSSAPGAIFPGNVTELIPGQDVILAGNDLSSPFTLDTEPPYIFRGAGSFLDFTDGTITQAGERPYDFEIGIWGSSSNPVTLFTDFVDNSIFEQLTDPLIVVSVDPAPLSSLTGEVVYMSNFDRVLGGSSAGAISDFFTAFNVDFSASLITDGFMEFCLGGGVSCSGENAQFWDFDFDGAVANGFVIASPVDNQGRINGQLASIFGFIEGAFTGDDAEAFVGGFNLYYDDDLDVFRSASNGVIVDIPDTTVDGVFLVEKDLRLSTADFDTYLYDDAFLVQEGYARTLLGYSRPTLDQDILFVDGRSRPRLVLTDPANEVSISNRNQNLPEVISDIFGLDWERWNGPLTSFTDNLDLNAFNDGGTDLIDDVAFFSTFRVSGMQDITGHYNRVLGFIGENETGDTISQLDMSFDINFSTSFNNVQNGSFKAFFGDSGEEWLAFFEGELVNNIVEFEFFDTNPNEIEIVEAVSSPTPDPVTMAGIYVDGVMDATIDFTDSNMQGVIIDDGRNTPALLSSFFFREDTEGPGRSLAGQTLVARQDPRLDMFGEVTPETNKAIVNLPYFNDETIISEALSGSPIGLNHRAYGVPSDEIRSDDYDVFFLGVDESDYYYLDGFYSYGNILNWCECSYVNYFSVDFLQTVSEHKNFAHFDENSFMLTEDEFDLDLGSWDGTIGLFELGIFQEYNYYQYYDEYEANNCGTTNFNCFGLDQEGFKSPAFWLNYSSFNYNPYIWGRFSTLLDGFGEFRLTDSEGGIVQVPVAQFMVELEIDFSSFATISGTIEALSESNPALTSPLQWLAYIKGDLDYPFDFVDSYELPHPQFDSESSGLSSTLGNADTEILFDMTGSEDLQILVGSIQSTQGLSDGSSLNLSAIFAARETRVGLLVERSSIVNGVFKPGSIYFGSASSPKDQYGYVSMTDSPRIGFNLDQDIANIDLSGPFEAVVTGISTVADATTDFVSYGIDQAGIVDSSWGYWASENMTIVHNQLGSQLEAGDEFLWATATPINPAELSGTHTVYSFEAIGFGTKGDGSGDEALINDFYMRFDVDFNSGGISNGEFKAALGTNTVSSPDWFMTFDGNVSGAFAEMDNFSGSINGSPILGEVKAVFTSPYEGLTGFSLFTEMGDYLNGIGSLYD